MRTLLRVVALLVALAVLVFWLFGGPNTKWTKTQVPIREKDPVTGIEVDRWEKRFVPGIDFLAAGIGTAFIIACCSFFFRRPNQPTPPATV